METAERRLMRERAITQSLQDTDLFIQSDETFTFIAEASRDLEWIHGIDLRRFGDRLTKEEVKAAGCRANTILTRQFVATLTDAGRQNAKVSADLLARSIGRNLNDSAYLLVDHGRPLQIFISNGAAGPCQAVCSYDGVILEREATPRLPLRDCSHPDQCFCRYLFYNPEPAPLSDEEREEVQRFMEQYGISLVTRIGPGRDR